jgi:hypothetical protein
MYLVCTDRAEDSGSWIPLAAVCVCVCGRPVIMTPIYINKYLMYRTSEVGQFTGDSRPLNALSMSSDMFTVLYTQIPNTIKSRGNARPGKWTEDDDDV